MTFAVADASAASHSDRVRAAMVAGDAVHSRIAASWQRCATYHGLDPQTRKSFQVLTSAELCDTSDRAGNLLELARPALSRLTAILAPYQACSGFAGSEGVMLALDTLRDSGQLFDWGLAKGVNWSELAAGTNGIGTCLVDEAPIVIRHKEHFYPRNTVMTCLAAPVFNQFGKIGGALNVSLFGVDVDCQARSLISSLVHATARQIEIDNFHDTYKKHRIISLATFGHCGSALLAVDGDDVVCGATRAARSLCELTDESVRAGLCGADLLEQLEDGLDVAERAVIRRALIRTNGNVSAAARSLGMSLATLKRRISLYSLKHAGKVAAAATL